MSKIQKDHRGFSAVEGMLVVAIVALIGFVGWYVWHARQNSDKILGSNSSASQSKSATSTKTSNSPGAKDNAALQSDLGSVSSASSKSSQDLNSSGTSLNDKSTFTSVPQ